jgi:hypothetical protein
LVNLGGVQDVYAPVEEHPADVLELLSSVGIRVHLIE